MWMIWCFNYFSVDDVTPESQSAIMFKVTRIQKKEKTGSFYSAAL